MHEVLQSDRGCPCHSTLPSARARALHVVGREGVLRACWLDPTLLPRSRWQWDHVPLWSLDVRTPETDGNECVRGDRVLPLSISFICPRAQNRSAEAPGSGYRATARRVVRRARGGAGPGLTYAGSCGCVFDGRSCCVRRPLRLRRIFFCPRRLVQAGRDYGRPPRLHPRNRAGQVTAGWPSSNVCGRRVASCGVQPGRAASFPDAADSRPRARPGSSAWTGRAVDGSRKAAAGPVSCGTMAPAGASTGGRACAGGLPRAAPVRLAPPVQTRYGFAQPCPIPPAERRRSRRTVGKAQLHASSCSTPGPPSCSGWWNSRLDMALERACSPTVAPRNTNCCLPPL